MISLNQSTILLKDRIKSVVMLQEMVSNKYFLSTGLKVIYP